MNIVLVPLIGPVSDNWIPAQIVHASCLDNFFRLFLPPPASELRAAARSAAATAEPEGVESQPVPELTEARYPNGFLVVDRDATLVDRIKTYVKNYLLGVVASEQVNETRVLKYFLRLLHSKPVGTILRQESVVVSEVPSSVTLGSDTAQLLVNSLRGNCDAVIAFESDNGEYRLRPMPREATPYTALYRSCDINLQQEALRRTWHWDRDPEEHCDWLGINPPDVTTRNWRMIGAALAFESEVQLCDRYIGESLYRDVLCTPSLPWRNRRDEQDAYTKTWARKWLASLSLMLDAWRTVASEVGNTRARTMNIWTAVDCDALSDAGWHFVARAERFLSNKLAGQVSLKVVRSPSSATAAGRKANEEMHPRYLIASTRAIRIDRGFDVLFQTPANELEHKYTEVSAQELSAVRFVQERWSEKGLSLLPRMSNPPLTWQRSMTRW